MFPRRLENLKLYKKLKFKFLLQVVVENVECGSSGLSCTKSAVITLDDAQILLTRGSDPLVSTNPNADELTKPAKFEIKEVGMFVVVTGSWKI